MTHTDEAFAPREVPLASGALTVFEPADVDAVLNDAILTDGIAPYGRVLWPSAIALAPHLEARSWVGVNVVELGCGVGLLSLLCARAGASVVATDVDARALAAVQRAAAALAARHSAPIALSTVAFDVTSAAPLPPADVVLVADMLYETALAIAVAERVAEARARGSEVVLADPHRAGRAAFVAALAARGVGVRFHACGATERADLFALASPGRA